MKTDKGQRPGYGKILDAWTPPEVAGEPVGCVATTFTFKPAFFEEECLGRFVGLETDPIEDGPAYLIEREEKLAQLTCAAVMVDSHEAHGVRSLRWDLLPARVSPGILHAKISLLLWSRCARVIVASANLTEDGYRRNQEVFGVLDYIEGSESPLSALDAIIQFLRSATEHVKAPGESEDPPTRRWLEFLDLVTRSSRGWGTAEIPRGFAKPRILALITGPGRTSLLEQLREVWPDDSPPDQAWVISPFFDPPEAPNLPAQQIWNVLKQRGSAVVAYDLTAEPIPGEDALLLHAPESLLKVQPAQRSGVEVMIRRLSLEDNRPLHAKCLSLESERLILHLIGSSNFTSAGLGVGKVKNLEANLIYIVGQQSGEAKKAVLNAWLDAEVIPRNLELRWKPRTDEGEDSPTGDWLVLPSPFGTATFSVPGTDKRLITLTFSGDPPAGWKLFPEESDASFVTELEWEQAGRPSSWSVVWSGHRPPSEFRVTWDHALGFAAWPVNVLDSSALPPPDELKDLPLDVLLDILTSSKPLHLALSAWLKRKPSAGVAHSGIELDPHRRVDTSSFLLQRTRRVSWAFTALRHRLERPVYSEQSLNWRLRGPVGVVVVAEALAREAKSEPERCFLLTELCLDLARVRPEEAPGSLSKSRVRSALKDLVRELREKINAAALGSEPAMADYVRRAFQEVLA